MQTIIRQTIIGIVLTIIYFGSAPAQTPIYYKYDAAGNRYLRTITLSQAKSAKAEPDSTIQSGLVKNEVADNKQPDSKTKVAFRDNLGGKKILIYPNPTQGQLKVDIEGYQEEANSGLYLYNLTGRLIISRTPVNSSTVLDLSVCPIGTYILKIVIGDKSTEWKIIKE